MELHVIRAWTCIELKARCSGAVWHERQGKARVRTQNLTGQANVSKLEE